MFNFFKKKKKDVVVQESQNIAVTDYADVTKVADYFKSETGISFDQQISILRNKAMTFCKQRYIYSFTKLLALIEADALVKQELIDYLTTNETFFYREFKQIELLVELVKNHHGNVKILCAPSATGEEPYSIAIALLEAGVSSSKFSIMGIDINSGALAKAREANYRQRNVRNLSAQIVSRYFNEENDIFTLKSTITALITFKQANIFDDSFKNIGKFDFIFSRNMLIYFDKETKLQAKSILESLRKDEKQDIFFGHADLF